MLAKPGMVPGAAGAGGGGLPAAGATGGGLMMTVGSVIPEKPKKWGGVI
jgi:hypothetical protein